MIKVTYSTSPPQIEEKEKRDLSLFLEPPKRMWNFQTSHLIHIIQQSFSVLIFWTKFGKKKRKKEIRQ